jgi:hypothetical protein
MTKEIDPRDWLRYDKDSGQFYWKKTTGRAIADEVAGTVSSFGYVKISLQGKKYMGHRLAWLYVHGRWPIGMIDHMNGVKNDNRIANLRDVTRSVNAQNRRTATAANALGVLGVGFRNGVYSAAIMLNKKHIFLGNFNTKEEAAAAYLAAKKLIHSGYVPESSHQQMSKEPT